MIMLELMMGQSIMMLFILIMENMEGQWILMGVMIILILGIQIILILQVIFHMELGLKQVIQSLIGGELSAGIILELLLQEGLY